MSYLMSIFMSEISMIRIKNAKVSRSGKTHYIAVPIDYIRNELINPNLRYMVVIKPIKQKSRKEFK